MMGISWGGFNALQVAARRPPALKAIVTICSTDDRYRDDVHYMGATKLNSGFAWASFLFGSVCRPPDPALAGEQWRDMWLRRLENVPLFLERWLRHQRRDAYWKHGSVCEDYSAIQCAVYAVGGWTDGYTNAIPRLLEHLTAPRKGLIGPWAHGYPHVALPGPQVGFLQEMLRWWDHWLKGLATGVMDEPMLRVWMTDSVRPAPYHETLPGRWIAEPAWPPPAIKPLRLFFTDDGLRAAAAPLTPETVCSAQSVGENAGSWCPFGTGPDQADDQQKDDARSLTFDTAPLDAAVEILGAPIVTLDVASDKPLANLAVRLCDVHPDGASSRVSFGILNLAHRDSHATPEALVPGQRYTIRVQLNDAGSVIPAGHKIRVALSTTYWPMTWPALDKPTVTVFGGTADLPERLPNVADTMLAPLPDARTAQPEQPTVLGPGLARIDRIGLTMGSERDFRWDMDGEDPLSAVAYSRQTQTMEREAWRTRIETRMRMSCTNDDFLLHAALRAWEGEDEVCKREWDYTIPRDLV
jgi:putative CocE/NonD family hydrolase